MNRRPPAIAVWILLCALLNVAGWVLSALHQLNAAGYLVTFAIATGGAICWCRREPPPAPKRAWWKPLRARFRRGLPLAFLVLAGLAFLGGALYLPSNHDALAYRTPRVLAWIAEGRWHWIHTAFPRLNTRPYGFEWLTAPLLIFTKSDRAFFLINFVSLLLLPGLIFSTFTRLGISARVAWHWMWPLASGYCFILAAGGIQNDLPGAPLALAMVDFALRAKKSGRIGEVWLSILAAALLTGIKTSTLPLLLPWVLALLPNWRLLLHRRSASALVIAIAVAMSFIPNAVMNARYLGDWTGQRIENIYQGGSVAERFMVNSAIVGIHNFLPPVFPFTRQWDDMLGKIAPALDASLRAFLKASDMATESDAGLGFGVWALLAASLIAVVWEKRRSAACPRRTGLEQLILFTPLFSALMLAGKAFITADAARYFVPYFIFLIAPLLACAKHEWVVRYRWWRASALATMGLAAALLVITPARPLFPSDAILSYFGTRTSSPLIARAISVYSMCAERPKAFAPIREALPPGARVVGLVSWDDPETSLWRPFGSRRVRHILPGDTPAVLRAQGISLIVVGMDGFAHVFGAEPFEHWLSAMDAVVVAKIPLRFRASGPENGLRDWMIVQLKEPNRAAPFF